MKEFTIHSVETVSEVTQTSSAKIVTYRNEKGDQKVKRIKNTAGRLPETTRSRIHRKN